MKTTTLQSIDSKKLRVHHVKRERAVYFDEFNYYKFWVKDWEHSRVSKHGFDIGFYDLKTAYAFDSFIVDEDGSQLGYKMKKGKVAGGSKDSWETLIKKTNTKERHDFIKTIFQRAKKNSCIVSDMCPANIVVIDNKISLIDYEGLASFDWFFSGIPQKWEAQNRNLNKYPKPLWRDMSKYLISYCNECLGTDYHEDVNSEKNFLILHDVVMEKIDGAKL